MKGNASAGASTVEQVLETLQDLSLSHPEYVYPWTSAQLFSEPATSFPLIGYGSLMSLDSAASTLGGAAIGSARPVRVLGARRVYDRVMSDRGRRRYGARQDEHFAVLNAYYTGDPRDWFNAMLFDLSPEDLPQMTLREHGYDLLPAWTTAWDDPHGKRDVAFFLSYRMPYRDDRKMLDPMLMPHPFYNGVCEQGCASVSAEFLAAFHQTTVVQGKPMNPTA